MLRQVSGNSVTVAPLKKCNNSRFNTPSKDIDSIIQKYIGTDRTSDTFTSSITTMFHNNLPEEKQLLVSPYKKLTEQDCNRYFSTFEKASSDHKQLSPPQDEFHHLQTSSDLSSLPSDSLHEIAQNLQQVFDSPQATHYTYAEKSPEFYNPETKLKSLPKELPVIEENDEIRETQQRLSGLITQIDQKIGLANLQVIEKIKDKYQPKQEQFLDFPEFTPSEWPTEPEEKQDKKSIQVKEFRIQAIRNVTFSSHEFNDLIQEVQQPVKYPILTVTQARLLVGTIIILLLMTLLSKTLI